MAVITGTSGNDSILPSGVSAGVTGGVPGSADDTIIGTTGVDTLDGGNRQDTLDYRAASTNFTVNFGESSSSLTGTDTAVTFRNIERVQTGSGNDSFTMSPGVASSPLLLVAGYAGNDVFNGNSDYRFTVDYSASPGRVVATLGTTGSASDGHGGTDTLINVVSIQASAFNDTITGGSGDDVLSGLAGDDVLTGAAGSNSLVGGAGNDRLSGGLDSDTAVYSGSESNYLIRRTSGGAFTVQDLRPGSPDGTDTLSGVENLFFQGNSSFLDTWNDPPRNDFSADGESDVLFLNKNSGLVLSWDLAGGGYGSSRAIAGVGTTDEWQLVGTGDFNDDGTCDILFKNKVTGLVLSWEMSNGDFSRSTPIFNAQTDWEIVGTGDFNGNGRDDILFQNITTGELQTWETGYPFGQIRGVTFTSPGTNWIFAGVGDFNGDGSDDILFRNQSNGLVSFWEMNSDGKRERSVTIAGAGSDWKLVGTGDFNGDFRDDILFQNSNSGLVLAWETSNGALSRSAAIAGAASDWRLVSTGDYNGDGTDDILFQNSNSGLVLNWEMANGAFSSSVAIAGAGGAIAGAGGDWQLIG
jgi:hypothetical protein